MKTGLLLSLWCMLAMVACSPSSKAADYGTKVGFKKGQALQFPDFVLTYVGDRHVASDRYPRGFDYRDFRVVAGKESQTVSWSAGTGDIGPALFKVGAKQFGLELARSDKLGKLSENEVVISRAP